MSKDSSRSGRTLADRADKYGLYQKSVQNADHEAEFCLRAYRDAYGRDARPCVLREDFCGTFAVCCEWVKLDPSHRAIGVDLDPEPVAWGREHNLARLDPAQRKRVTLVQADVRDVHETKADIVAAENFSYWLFKTRDGLRDYFKAARANLRSRGVLLLDMMGGSSLQNENQKDKHQYKGFRYEWEQARFDPITHDALFHIHFKFKDGSRLRRAFTYDWRLWTLPEVRELLAEAGFRDSVVYWEGADPRTGKGNNVWRRRKHAHPDDCWIAYVAGIK